MLLTLYVLSIGLSGCGISSCSVVRESARSWFVFARVYSYARVDRQQSLASCSAVTSRHSSCLLHNCDPYKCHRVCTGAGVQGVYRGRSAGCVQEQVLQGLRGCLTCGTYQPHTHVSLQPAGCSFRPGSQLLSGREAPRVLKTTLAYLSAEGIKV